VAAAKAMAAWVEGKEKSRGQVEISCRERFKTVPYVRVGFSDPINGRERWKMFFITISDINAVNKKDRENKMMNFLSRLLIPGFFRSSKITTIIITKIQIRIELPLREKKEKKELKKVEWGIIFRKNKVIELSKLIKLSIILLYNKDCP